MTTTINWLPNLIDNTKFQNFNDFVKHLYDIFKQDFQDKNKPIYFQKMKVQFASKLINCSSFVHQGHCSNKQYHCSNCYYKGKEDIFNHLTCHDNLNKRIPGIFDLQRAIRIVWIRPIIENYTNSEILFGKEPYKKQMYTIYLWLEKWEYIVILRETKKQQLFLTTAFYVDKNSHYAKTLSKKYYNSKKTP